MFRMLKDKSSNMIRAREMGILRLTIIKTLRVLIPRVLRTTRMRLRKLSPNRLKESLIWLKQPQLSQEGSFPVLRRLKRGLILRIVRKRNEVQFKVKYWLKLKPRTRPMSRNRPEIFLLNSNLRSEVASRWPQKEAASVATQGLFK